MNIVIGIATMFKIFNNLRYKVYFHDDYYSVGIVYIVIGFVGGTAVYVIIAGICHGKRGKIGG